MKSLISTVLALLACQILFAQSIPQTFSYQAIARDAQGNCLVDQSINLQFSILDGSETGPALFVERHENVQTNAVGHFQVMVGTGFVQTTGSLLDFALIDWPEATRFLKVELADGGTTNFSTVGVTQLLSVPYAMAAQEATTADTAAFSDLAQMAIVTDSAIVAQTAWNGKLTSSLGDDSLAFFGPGGSENVVIGTGGEFGFFEVLDSANNQRVRIASSSVREGAGNIAMYGGNGSTNATLGHGGVGAGVNKGRLTLRDENGDVQVSLSIDANGDGVLAGDLKPFVMDHPTQQEKEIWYCAIEGPEAAAYERGTATLVNGEAEITFSDHFEIVANPTTMTITTSPWSAESKGLAVIERTATGFKVKELFGGTGNYQFDWRVDAKRKGHEDFQVIRDKKDSPFYVEE